MQLQTKAEELTRKLSSFWIGPLVVGSCLATGYEVTQRLIILKSTHQQPKIELSKTSRPSSEKNVATLQVGHSVQTISLKVNKESKTTKPGESIEDKGIQSLLQALETDFERPEMMPKPNRSKRFLSRSANQELSISNPQSVFGQKKFDELFKTLSES